MAVGEKQSMLTPGLEAVVDQLSAYKAEALTTRLTSGGSFPLLSVKRSPESSIDGMASEIVYGRTVVRRNLEVAKRFVLKPYPHHMRGLAIPINPDLTGRLIYYQGNWQQKAPVNEVTTWGSADIAVFDPAVFFDSAIADEISRTTMFAPETSRDFIAVGEHAVRAALRATATAGRLSESPSTSQNMVDFVAQKLAIDYR